MGDKNKQPLADTRERVEAEYRYMIFDKFVDLALDGEITLEQALTGYMEEIHTDEASQ